MTYIEIQPGFSVKATEIEGIEKMENNRTKVYFHHRTQLSRVPYETLLSMLKGELIEGRGESDEVFMKRTMQKLDKVLGKAQHFGG